MSIEKVIEGIEKERVSIDVRIDAQLSIVRKLLKSKLSLTESILIFLDKAIEGNRAGELSEEKINKILAILDEDKGIDLLLQKKVPGMELSGATNYAKNFYEKLERLDGNGLAQHDADFRAGYLSDTEFEGVKVEFKKRSLAGKQPKKCFIKSNLPKKFNTYLREIIEYNPEKKFDVSKLEQKMRDAVTAGVVKEPENVRYTIQGAIWYMKKSGMITEADGFYQWNKEFIPVKSGRKKAELDEPENLSLLDEAIIDILRSYKKTAGIEYIDGEVRKCLNFLEISKSLSGGLNSSLRESLESLTSKKLIIENNEGWRIK